MLASSEFKKNRDKEKKNKNTVFGCDLSSKKILFLEHLKLYLKS